MGQLRNTEQVCVGDTPEVLEHLRDPRVLGVVWTGVWSEASRAFADSVTAKPENNIPGSGCRKFTGFTDTEAGAAFRHEYQRLKSVFEEWGARLLGDQPVTPIHDLKIEPAVANETIKWSGEWHVDGGHLVMVSAPSGFPSEYLANTPAGRFIDTYGTFRPADALAAETAAQSVPNDAALIFKGTAHPRGRGLIHRRPNGKLESVPTRGRMLLASVL